MNESMYKLVGACLILYTGMLIGENHRGKGPIFTSWYGNDLYYGESVKLKSIDDGADFYNGCKKLTIIGLQAVDNKNEAWLLLENCPWSKNRFETDTFYQDNLESK